MMAGFVLPSRQPRSWVEYRMCVAPSDSTIRPSEALVRSRVGYAFSKR
ncbi:hypothetical protein CSUI_002327 [Cystoisospora suis]|uniref:Uncharacterized protein n=1 Tax=Cystoisospora suis TaxID=483139 RepID=A0A2C6L6W9_9APIC|nr:hypothetical protein CSUI_002327 [Cystoisospora suis]